MTTDTPPRLRVFISYAQEDPAHSARVLALANALRRDGIATELDQYHQQELIDWPRWCREQLRPDRSDWVLLICTPVYKARVEDPVGTGAAVGRGVYWEGAAILNAIYADKGNARFVSLLLDEAPDESVPGALEAYTHFRLRGFGLASADPGYEGLYRLLTHQPGVVPPEPPAAVALAPWAEPGGAPTATVKAGPSPGAAVASIAPAPAPNAAGPARRARPVLQWLAPAVLLLGLGAGAFWRLGREAPESARQLKLAEAARDTGRYEDALAAYRAALALNGADETARYGQTKARVLADSSPTFDQEGAVRRLAALREEAPKDPHLPMMLGRLAQLGGDPGRARALYGEALALDAEVSPGWCRGLVPNLYSIADEPAAGGRISLD
ncbi:SEFIR domain-containing protein [Candidatus Thiodictyon syntrophicum]|jgi:tetratricopeptide (TPR) repeat protein|uniref:SEFIR domain-containing protein n=1 Tax=Candidatus Thiodictyon syntrophicum TaxID=1166950 RepID=A0A2K8UFW1_9GAMM|nr:SEFIR domain-containing protein [Candidatus Thiodictyon syntrophicum]AUB84438.1 hypothetical protein THSYN_28195 [Candidatus Thiodictyon syntrophicum]